jgi:hypothetical protein
MPIALSLRQQGTSSFVLFEMLARRANISNKKKEKYHTAARPELDEG